MNRFSKIQFDNEIVLHDGIEFRVSGKIEQFEGYIETMMFESIIETGSPNDSMKWIHLSSDHLFRKAVEKKIGFRITSANSEGNFECSDSIIPVVVRGGKSFEL